MSEENKAPETPKVLTNPIPVTPVPQAKPKPKAVPPKPEFQLITYIQWMIELQKRRIEILHQKERGKNGKYDPLVKNEMYLMTYLMRNYTIVAKGGEMEEVSDKTFGIDPQIRKAAEKKVKDLMSMGVDPASQ